MSESAPGWPSFADLRARLDACGFRPSRRLGQNFMLDPNLAAAICRDGGVQDGDWVLEVGPGPGALTFQLASLGAQLTALEIDERLLGLARENLSAFPEVQWILADALAGKNELAPELLSTLPDPGTPWKLVANLPYSISSPLMALLAQSARAPTSMTCLIQKEVAERIVAAPGSSSYGPLTVALTLGYRAEIVRTVGRELFWPRPQVESAVVRLDRLPEAPNPVEMARVRALAQSLLGRRRQSLGRLIGELLPRPEEGGEGGPRARAEAWLGSLGIDASRRAETLQVAELRCLADRLKADPGDS
ncbi:MAG: 16S rRNA (adenine(1518)-N(6)/adenine(1519)-N(6))-dimethyltransferase RsmA [Planctomycetota bacterium]